MVRLLPVLSPLLFGLLWVPSAWAQDAAPKAAAMVNGRAITEAAVQRALKPIDKANHEKARVEIVNFLVENALVDHYLELLKVTVEAKDVDAQLATFKKEITEAKRDYAKVLQDMELTEAELKGEIMKQLRWEKFVAEQATDQKVRRLFDSSPEVFDGSVVRARHILVTPATKDAAGNAAALKKAQTIRAELTKAIATAEGKIPSDADNLTKQKHLNRATDEAFSASAKASSECPSKRDGGDLGEFPRMGVMVEPFAKAAFGLKPFEVSEPVQTPFGYHLIMVTQKKAGEKVDFEKVKGAVIEVYGSKLREAIVEKMKADRNTSIQIIK